MRSSRDSAGDPERRLAATASGSRERRREATGVPKQPATATSYGTSPAGLVPYEVAVAGCLGTPVASRRRSRDPLAVAASLRSGSPAESRELRIN